MKLIKVKGLYSDIGKIEFENMKSINLNEFSDEQHLEIPFGSSVELSIEYDENNFLSGKDNIVWATYDLRQGEIIQNTLLAQNINSETAFINFVGRQLILIKITNQSDMKDAIDFIWKSNNGLRLKPDWSYPDGEANKSFELWLSGH